jgi:hypothetical protein
MGEVELIEDGLGTSQKDVSGLGQRQSARRPLEDANAEFPLHLSDHPGHGRWIEITQSCRRRKAAELRDIDKDPQAIDLH